MNDVKRECSRDRIEKNLSGRAVFLAKRVTIAKMSRNHPGGIPRAEERLDAAFGVRPVAAGKLFSEGRRGPGTENRRKEANKG
jgi:hypothetical protein